MATENVRTYKGGIAIQATITNSGVESGYQAWGFSGATAGSTDSELDDTGETYVNVLDADADGADATSGYGQVSSTTVTFIGAGTENTALSATGYTLNLTIDTTLRALTGINLSATSDWDAVAAAIQVILRVATSGTETVEISGGYILVTSADTTGTASTVLIEAGAGTGDGDLLAAIDTITDMTTTIETPVAGVDATAGTHSISSSGTLTFIGATVPQLASATYDLDINEDTQGNNPLAIALLITDDWDGIAAKIQVALRAATSTLETVAISAGTILVTSATTGASSTIDIVAGTAGSGGGDLLTAIDLLSRIYTASISVDGTPNAISIIGSASQTMTEVCTEIEADLSGATCAFDETNDEILVTSTSNEEESKIVITDTDLFAGLALANGSAETAVGGVNITIDSALSGRDFVYSFQLLTSAGADTTSSIVASYSTVTGILSFTEGSGTMSEGDVLTVAGSLIGVA